MLPSPSGCREDSPDRLAIRLAASTSQSRKPCGINLVKRSTSFGAVTAICGDYLTRDLHVTDTIGRYLIAGNFLFLRLVAHPS